MTQDRTEALREFRAELRAWLADNRPEAPSFRLPQSFLEVESDAQFEFLRDWQRRVYDAGYLGFDVPEKYGGQGVDNDKKRITVQEMVRARTPFLVNVIGLHWAGPTILMYGSEAQKQRMLAPLLRGDEIWCQGFSEPEHGSDLASLQTRARPSADGERYHVSGHKVWTTLAHVAKWMILLARTGSEGQGSPAAEKSSAAKYAGLSYFLFPMDAEGVTIQPLVKMTGEGGFNQVIFDEAPMPKDALLGKEGQGWQVAMTTLAFERGAADPAARERGAQLVALFERLASLAARIERDGAAVIDDAVAREKLVALRIEAEALRWSGVRAAVPGLCSERPMVLPLMSKLTISEFNQRVTDLAVELLGAEAQLWLEDAHAIDAAEWPRAYLNSYGFTIGGGTSEIQRNILGERVLGLAKSK